MSSSGSGSGSRGISIFCEADILQRDWVPAGSESIEVIIASPKFSRRFAPAAIERLTASGDAWMRHFSGSDQADLHLHRAHGRSMGIDPYTLNCAEVATQLRRWRSDLLRAK